MQITATVSVSFRLENTKKQKQTKLIFSSANKDKGILLLIASESATIEQLKFEYTYFFTLNSTFEKSVETKTLLYQDIWTGILIVVVSSIETKTQHHWMPIGSEKID